MASIDVQRSILTSTIFRFSPQTQPVRQTALDRIVENALYHSGDDSKSTEISDLFREEEGIAASPPEVEETLKRLCEEGRIHKVQGSRQSYYLDPETREEIETQHEEAKKQKYKIVEELLGYTEENAEEYISPFILVLSRIFAELGGESVQLLQGNSSHNAEIDSKSVERYCHTAANSTAINADILQQAIEDFFESNDPDYNALKWQLAQNFFISKSIGLNHGGSILAGDTFDGALFYIDTNVAIPALEPVDNLHYSFEIITDACERLNADIKICKITIEDLTDFLDHKFGEITKAVESVGEKVFDQVDSIFSKVYKIKRGNDTYEDVRSLFENFNDPEERLLEEYNIETSLESWFTNEKEDDPQTERLVTQVRRASREERAGKDKHPDYQAKHDALLLRWVQYQRQQGYNAWVLTADTSLPAVEIPEYDGKALAITINALLQWVSPIMDTDVDDEQFQSVFANLMRKRVLPQERFFTMSDFAIFKELNISLKKLPKKDIEKCANIIKKESASLDLNNAEDREKLNHKIKRFLADPGSGYQKEIARLEREKEQLTNKNSENEDRINDLEDEVEDYQDRIGSIEEELEDERRKQRLRGSGWRRLIALVVATIILILFAVYLAYSFGDQEINVVARIKSRWLVYSGILAGSVAVGGWWIEPRRFKAMGLWPQ